MTKQSYSQDQLAGIIGKARTTITEILTLDRLPQEIRDECRGDRVVSRAALLEIAGKKQPRGMVTAYNKYKERLKKQQEGGKKKEKAATSPADVLEWLDKTGHKLGAIDAAAWTDDQKAALAQTLEAIRTTIEAMLRPDTGREAQE